MKNGVAPSEDAVRQERLVVELASGIKMLELGLAENTLIILSSDNGPAVDDGYDDKAEELLNGHSPAGPWRGNKYSAFEGGTAVPAIVRWPKKIKENRCLLYTSRCV